MAGASDDESSESGSTSVTGAISDLAENVVASTLKKVLRYLE